MAIGSAKGATLKYKSLTVWTALNNIGDFTFPLPPPDIVDVTNHGSPNGQEQSIISIKKNPKITIPIIWDEADTSHQWLVTNNATIQAFQYTGTGTGTTPTPIAFNAAIELTFDNKVKDAKRASLTLTVTDGNIPT